MAEINEHRNWYGTGWTTLVEGVVIPSGEFKDVKPFLLYIGQYSDNDDVFIVYEDVENNRIMSIGEIPVDGIGDELRDADVTRYEYLSMLDAAHNNVGRHHNLVDLDVE